MEKGVARDASAGEPGAAGPTTETEPAELPHSAKSKDGALPLQIEVTHGDLRGAKFPLFVGHYEGDGIVSAEREIDRQLAGRLSKRQALGLYPGPIASAHVFAPPDRDPDGPKPYPGAVVIGLGQVGHLTPGALMEAFRSGILELVSATAEGKLTSAWRGNKDGIGISTLVIGGTAGGVASRDAIYSVFRAVEEVNVTIGLLNRSAHGANAMPVVLQIEFIELYQDRAHSTFHIIRDLNELAELNAQLSPEIRVIDGWRRRVRFDADPPWWRRVEITESDGQLRFKVLTDTARAEGYATSAQLALVKRLINDATKDVGSKPELSKMLFELLIPNALKSAAPHEGNLMLVLDQAAAELPWELLAREYRGSFSPLVTQTRVLRQLTVAPGTFRVPASSAGDFALVIGDTDAKGMSAAFPELIGAQREAELVTRILGEAQFKVTSRIRPDALEATSLLLTTSYRVLHLAAHGVHEFGPDREKVTGMVLGDGLYLTAKEINQMTNVPDLVFLNCCYLGKMDPQPGFHRVASNLAAQFMQNGVRCLVAAGWMVDDVAARYFAEQFYDALRQQSFGEAIHWARRKTFARFKDINNTWGAFQCYGDPGYMLEARRSERSAATEPGFGSVDELCVVLDEIRDRAATAEEQTLIGLAHRLKKLKLDAPTTWLGKSARLSEAFGRAFAAIEDFDNAIASYKAGMQASRADASLAMLEQLMNVSARQAAREALRHRHNGSSAEIDRLRTGITGLIRQFEAWTALYGTGERRSILGSAWKRLAALEAACGDLKAMRSHLLQSVREYTQASDLAGGNDFYSMSQIALGKLMAGWAKPAGRTEALGAIDALKPLLEKSGAPSDFWDLVYAADYRFLRALYAIAAQATGADLDPVVNCYATAIDRWANQQQRRSLAETFEFAIAVLETYAAVDGEPGKRAARGVAFVRELAARLDRSAVPTDVETAPLDAVPATAGLQATVEDGRQPTAVAVPPVPGAPAEEAASGLVYFNGIDPDTGSYAVPPISVPELAKRVRANPGGAAVTDVQRSVTRAARQVFGQDLSSLVDVGWGIVFATDTAPEIREALAPLIEHRREQAGSLLKVLDYKKEEQVREWYRRHNIAVGTFEASAVPYYLLLVGPPTAIPYEFQYLMGVEYAVGRLAFERPEDYARYAASIIDYETRSSVPNSKEIAYWATRHRGDNATRLSATQLVDPLANGIPGPDGGRKPPIHSRLGYSHRLLTGTEAVRDALLGMLHADKAPAILFTASHGMSIRPERPNQMTDNGALLCQDWTGIGPIKREHYLAASNVSDDANVSGTVAFLFACFGCGTPDVDQFLKDLSGKEKAPQLAPQPFVAALPQRLLAHPRGSALAVLGHVDRALGYSIQPSRSTGGQIGPFHDTLGFIMEGRPIGRVLSEIFGQRFSSLSVLLLSAVSPTTPALTSDRDLVTYWLERNDAQNYILLGDPAVRIRKDAFA